MAEKCPECGSFELDVDEVEGLVVCTSCGRVVDESVVLYSTVQDDHVYVTGDGTQTGERNARKQRVRVLSIEDCTGCVVFCS
jgi:transcription initiation factor TFIIIB Brf1 subunit/transcription initiation factor TFIIB